MIPRLQFEVIAASPSNYEYALAHGADVSAPEFTDEQLARFAEYIRSFVPTSPSEDTTVPFVELHGPFVYSVFPKMAAFVRRLGDSVFPSVITLDSIDMFEHRDEIMALWSAVGSNLRFNVKTTLLEDEDSAAVVGSPYYNLRWALARGFCSTIVVNLTPANSDRVVDMLDRFRKLRDVYPHIICKLRVDESAPEIAGFDENVLRVQFGFVQQVLDTDDELKRSFIYSVPPALRTGRAPEALMAGLTAVLCDGGVLYPGYDVKYMSPEALDTLALGNIADDLAVLDAGRALLVKQLDESGGGYTGDCYDKTRAVPWEDPDHALSLVPSAQSCVLHELLAEYLPYRLTTSSAAYNGDSIG